jgi:Fe-S oxidoreductase
MKNSADRQPENTPARTPVMTALNDCLRQVSAACNDCGACLERCEFLRRWGTPGRIAAAFDPGQPASARLPFGCCLCGLCTVLCPRGIDGAGLFLTMRRAAAAAGNGRFKAHRPLLRYEAWGSSPRFSWYGFPEGCDTVFFPGCALPGTRPGQSLALFGALRAEIPGLGICLDCCSRPSHDLGRSAHFRMSFGAMERHFSACGIGTVVTACPGCHKVFKAHGGPLRVISAYEVLPGSHRMPAPDTADGVMLFDPCAARFEGSLQRSVRRLTERAGIRVIEMPFSGLLTDCCGEGAGVGHLRCDPAFKQTAHRPLEANGHRIVTYCAGCADALSRGGPTWHILDLIFPPAATAPFGAKVHRSPMTYLNRLRLKGYLRRQFSARVRGERPFSQLQNPLERK